VTILLFAGLSYYFRNEIYIKFQPVILSIIFGLSLIISYFFSKPLLYEFSLKYRSFFSENQQQVLFHPQSIALLKFATPCLGVALLLHAFVTALAAIKLSNWWWIAIRGIGFYLFSFLSFVVARLFI